jgi:hypothetical protein
MGCEAYQSQDRHSCCAARAPRPSCARMPARRKVVLHSFLSLTGDCPKRSQGLVRTLDAELDVLPGAPRAP